MVSEDSTCTALMRARCLLMMLLLAADSNRGGLRCAACARGKHVPRGSPYSHASSIHPGFVEISLACIHAYPHCCSCVACIRFGALLSRQPTFFCFLYCDIYVCVFWIRGCPVVLDIELSVSASEDSTCTVLLRAKCLLLLLLLAADSGDRRCAVCGITFKITCNMERKQKNVFVCQNTK